MHNGTSWDGICSQLPIFLLMFYKIANHVFVCKFNFEDRILALSLFAFILLSIDKNVLDRLKNCKYGIIKFEIFLLTPSRC